MKAAEAALKAADDCRVALVRPATGVAAAQSLRALEQISVGLCLPLLEPGMAPQRDSRCDLYLSIDETGPYLQLTGGRAPGPVRCGFLGAAMAHRRRGGQNELLGRAVGVHKRAGCRVVDATAGFAADGFVLADLGARVLLCEQHPLLAALLDLSVQHLQSAGDDWQQAVASRLSVRPGDTRTLSTTDLGTGDVLYLDPMFPGGKRSAAGKGMALLQRLLAANPPDSAETLLHWALRQPVWRVVVKRPLKAPHLCGLRPSHSLAGRSVRFDVYHLEGVKGDGA